MTKIEVTVQDTTGGQVIYGYGEVLVDLLHPAPGGGISFRLHSAPVRIAGATVGSIMKKLREFQDVPGKPRQ